jgi:citrate lyase beta subunit
MPLLVRLRSADGLDAAARFGVSALVIDSRAAASVLADRWRALASPRPHLVAAIAAPNLPDAHALLTAAMALRPTALLVEDVASGEDIVLTDARMAVAEAELGIGHGATRILAVAGATASSLFALGTLRGASARLTALVHDPHALRRSLAFEDDAELVRLSRTLVVAAAKAGNVIAVDADDAVPVEVARRQGFEGKLYGSLDAIDIGSFGIA